jgi:hypothetical protein
LEFANAGAFDASAVSRENSDAVAIEDENIPVVGQWPESLDHRNHVDFIKNGMRDL